MLRLSIFLVVLLGSLGIGGSLSAEKRLSGKNPASILTPESRTTYEKRILPFLKQHCWKCHDADSAKAGFQVDALGTDFLAGKTGNHWREVVDKINLGKMPPRKEPRPDANEAFVVVEWVNAELRNAEKRAQSMGGRSPMRRLNRTEYANTVRDLFHLDENFARKIEQELPADGKVDGFDRGGAALLVDRGQLEAYLNAARAVVDEALPLERPKETKYHHVAVKDTNLVKPIKKKTTMKEILTRSQQYSNLYSKIPVTFPEIERGPETTDFNTVRDGGVEVVLAAHYTGDHLAYLQRGDIPRKVVTRDGWYRIRVKAGASRGSGKFAVDAVRVKVDYCRGSRENGTAFAFTIDAPLDRPKVYEKLVFLRHGGENFEKVLTFTWNVYRPERGEDHPLQQHAELYALTQAVQRAANNYENAKAKKEDATKIDAARAKRDEAYARLRKFAEEFTGPVYHVRPDVDLAALPRIWYEYVDLEGPVTAEWPTKAAREVFFAGERKSDLGYARDVFARLLPRAYRRPVAPREVDALVEVVKTMQRKHGKTFADAVREAVVAVLTSAEFLFLQEPGEEAQPRELNDYELANRLSYFLWSAPPDAKLVGLATQKQLHLPSVLRAEITRMSADAKARQFVENFTGQWLRVRDFNSVMVDVRQYRDYDEALRDSSQREPYEFVHELLRGNRPVINLLDSDFVVVNERLARHYGIEGVQGDAFRRVTIKPAHRRGGVLGMAGVLTYLSDGTRTLPVKRGAYVLDVLWNRPAPLPPPNAGDLPVVKGKNLTVRQRLEQHRSEPTCASCHARIDPLGLALENYDAVGAWRDRQNGEGRKGGPRDPPIDPSGVLPGGKGFRTLPEFKKALLAEKEKFLHGFTEKLLAYALGRPIGAADRETMQAVLDNAAREEYRLQAMLQAVVATRAFRTK